MEQQFATIHRSPSEGVSETVTWLCGLFNVDRRVAYHVFVEKCFRVGTDRYFYVDTTHARKFIDTLPSLS